MAHVDPTVTGFIFGGSLLVGMALSGQGFNIGDGSNYYVNRINMEWNAFGVMLVGLVVVGFFVVIGPYIVAQQNAPAPVYVDQSPRAASKPAAHKPGGHHVHK